MHILKLWIAALFFVFCTWTCISDATEPAINSSRYELAPDEEPGPLWSYIKPNGEVVEFHPVRKKSQTLQDEKSFVNSLRARLADKNALVRKHVALALGDLRDKSAVPDLRRLLADNDASVVNAAAQSLEEILFLPVPKIDREGNEASKGPNAK